MFFFNNFDTDNKEVTNDYAKNLLNYKEDLFFERNTIEIGYIGNTLAKTDDKRKYLLTHVNVLASNSDEIKSSLRSIVEKCDFDIKNKSQANGWQLFYLYKELLQRFTSNEFGFNYFRGQSVNKPLLPGIMRDEVDKSYINNFERIYRKLSYEFPEKINYTEFNGDDCITSRERDLSLLQHYGLKTALLDITRNPYIAMLFMIKENIREYIEPTLYLFNINEQLEKDETLFTEVRKNQTNERILAQKGAFLNYEKTLLKNKNYKKIPYIKIVLRFDDTVYKEVLNKEIDAYTELKKYIKDQGHRDLEKFLENDLTELNKQLDSIEKYKVNALKDILEDLENKLNEYCYTKEEMFPDFENRIRYLSNKYNKSGEDALRYTRRVSKNNNKNHN
ncbi:FRG domain-containing protein [Fenollaria timonensis]|uniref:FRG domain-containing protein n=1 Tax=Fenollaria timonensis TaxID=1723384 RepID=UPI000AF01C45|nr:FRG domain-containing protein [Fenollaria timonensis]